MTAATRQPTPGLRLREDPDRHHRPTSAQRGVLLCAAALLLITSTAHAAEPTASGTIRAPLQPAEGQEIARVVAVERQVQTLRTRRDDELDIGVEAVTHQGELRPPAHTDNAAPPRLVEAVFDSLPVPGQYDLRIELADGAIIHGWNANVPPSDYVGDPALEPDQVSELLERQGDDEFTAFFDHAQVLDIQGNVQHATLLVAQLRRRPFVGGGYQQGEWIWRVDRWQWQDPWEHNWTPDQQRPFYALVRQRVFEDQFNALQWRFARHLGGFELSPDAPTLELDPFVLPTGGAGVRAVEPAGELIEPRTIKGDDVFSPDASDP